MRFKVRVIMCDLDGTLIHSAPQIAEAANQMLGALGKPKLPVAQITGYIGEGAQMLIKRCLTGQLYEEPEAALFAQAGPLFYRFYADNVGNSVPFDGVLEGLQDLKREGFKLACVTNKPEKFTQPLLEKSGLVDFFEIVVSGDTLPRKKPDPMPLHHICKALKVLEAEALLVGDSYTDIAAAQAAGCFVVTVPYGYNQGRPIDESLVDATINRLDELTALIDLH